MEKAIKKAIEGGWRPKAEKATDILTYSGEIIGIQKTAFLGYSQMLLDPLFWQALGKAMGWKGTENHNHELNEDCSSSCWGMDGWQLTWHRFIDHISSGKDADSFFEELLK